MMIEIRKRLMLATSSGNSTNNNKRRLDRKPTNRQTTTGGPSTPSSHSDYYYTALPPPHKRDADATSMDSHDDDSDSEPVPKLLHPEDFLQSNQSSIHTCRSIVYTPLSIAASIIYTPLCVSVTPGAKVCLVFSLSGCVFLGILALLLARPSCAMYLKAGPPHLALERSRSVGLAGAMYGLCAAVAAYCWLGRHQPALHLLLARQRDRVRSAAAGLEA